MSKSESALRVTVEHLTADCAEKDKRIAELEAENARLKTPAAKWREAGKPDPLGDYYDCERAKLCMGHLTDDELANEVFMKSGIGELTAAKERIRWLSRLVVKLQSHSANTVGGPTPVMDAAPAWQSMDTAPTDGREFLIRYPLQGNVKQLACWNNIHKYWQSKGEPITPMQQKCEWYPLP